MLYHIMQWPKPYNSQSFKYCELIFYGLFKTNNIESLHHVTKAMVEVAFIKQKIKPAPLCIQQILIEEQDGRAAILEASERFTTLNFHTIYTPEQCFHHSPTHSLVPLLCSLNSKTLIIILYFFQYKQLQQFLHIYFVLRCIGENILRRGYREQQYQGCWYYRAGDV